MKEKDMNFTMSKQTSSQVDKILKNGKVIPDNGTYTKMNWNSMGQPTMVIRRRTEKSATFTPKAGSI